MIKSDIYNENKVVEKIMARTNVKETFSMVVEHYKEELYYFIRHIVLLHDDADKVLQQVFLKAWENICYLDYSSKLSVLLYRLAIGESLFFLNAKYEHNVETEEFIFENLKNDRFFRNKKNDILLLRAVYNLPENERIIFLLKYYNQFDDEKISEILGFTIKKIINGYKQAVDKIIVELKLS